MEEVTKTKVIALTQFSNGSVSMFKGEIREMDSTTAETLISNGLVEAYEPDVPPVTADDKNKYLHMNETTGEKEWSEVSGGGGGGGMLKVIASESGDDLVLDKNYNEIHEAVVNGNGAFVLTKNGFADSDSYTWHPVIAVEVYENELQEIVYSVGTNGEFFESSSPTGVLSLQL